MLGHMTNFSATSGKASQSFTQLEDTNVQCSPWSTETPIRQMQESEVCSRKVIFRLVGSTAYNVRDSFNNWVASVGAHEITRAPYFSNTICACVASLMRFSRPPLISIYFGFVNSSSRAKSFFTNESPYSLACVSRFGQIANIDDPCDVVACFSSGLQLNAI